MTEPLAWDAHLQRLTNAHPVPARFTDAPWPNPKVTVRLVWEHDGEETRETEAWAWTRDLVLVYVRDTRVQVNGAWLAAQDVQRV